MSEPVPSFCRKFSGDKSPQTTAYQIELVVLYYFSLDDMATSIIYGFYFPQFIVLSAFSSLMNEYFF